MKKDNIYVVDSPLYKLGYTAKVCQRYFNLFFKENCTKLGLTEGEYVVLDTIERTPEISQIDLARLLFKGRSHITQLLNSLEERKLITREQAIKNGRKVLHTELTDDGKKVYNEIKNICKSKFKSIWEYFDKKEDVFVGMLAEIQEILTEGQPVKFD